MQAVFSISKKKDDGLGRVSQASYLDVAVLTRESSFFWGLFLGLFTSVSLCLFRAEVTNGKRERKKPFRNGES